MRRKGVPYLLISVLVNGFRMQTDCSFTKL